jgi:hypothetical protein
MTTFASNEFITNPLLSRCGIRFYSDRSGIVVDFLLKKMMKMKEITMMFISSPLSVPLRGRGYCKRASGFPSWVKRADFLFGCVVVLHAARLLASRLFANESQGKEESIHKVEPITHTGNVMCLHYTHNKQYRESKYKAKPH